MPRRILYNLLSIKHFSIRYFGHEVVIDLFNRAMLPPKSSSSSTSLSASTGDSANGNGSSEARHRSGSVASSVAPSPMSTSDPPTPSTMPPSPTSSTSSFSPASFGSLGPPSSLPNQPRDGNDAGGDAAEPSASLTGASSADIASRLLLPNVSGDASAGHSSSSSDDVGISASITRQRGIVAETQGLRPADLFNVLNTLMQTMAAQTSGENMVRRNKLIAAHMGKLLKV